MRKNHLLILITLVFLTSCGLFRKKSNDSVIDNSSNDYPIKNTSSDIKELEKYRSTESALFDLIHTRLDLSFDYNNQSVKGEAAIRLRPHFYPQDTIILDAKNFNIESIYILYNNTIQDCKYIYRDRSKLYIYTGKKYTSKDILEVVIKYTAIPGSSDDKGSAAIRDDKGLYFINPLRNDPYKTRQIWSQGETQSNSNWFPTIDVPNQKMTQEINLTVDDSDITISNGRLLFSTYDAPGKRTDHWIQNLPHAPYLTMIAIGRWAEVKDFWRDSIPLHYYLSPEYLPYSDIIFGKTPQMLECFSKKLNYSYPWDKFDQIVVYDFVSGAMENTTAVIHGERLQHDNREHLDNTHEDVIAHEMFHHWFGDLVTCESWSNLPLNESFATYGEYIWREYAYGREDADFSLSNDYDAYMNEAADRKKKLIRFYYADKEDMFDNHSYQKGGCVLHMLRHMVGDEAFFQSLNVYLKKRAYKTAEIHDLRMAFEEVTGLDLNEFFNDFFLTEGHPSITTQYSFDSLKGAYTIVFNQNSEHLFQFPVSLAIYKNGNVIQTSQVLIKDATTEVSFKMKEAPDWVNIDTSKSILWNLGDNKSIQEWYHQFKEGKLFADKHQALDAIQYYIEKEGEEGKLTLDILKLALNEPFWAIRWQACQLLSTIESSAKLEAFLPQLKMMVTNDPKSTVRKAALQILAKKSMPAYAEIYKTALNDLSYEVSNAALFAMLTIDTASAVVSAEKNFNSDNKNVYFTGSNIVAEFGNGKYSERYKKLLSLTPYMNRFTLYNDLRKLLMRTTDTAEAAAITGIFQNEYEIKGRPWFINISIKSYLKEARAGQKNMDIKAIITQALLTMPEDFKEEK